MESTGLGWIDGVMLLVLGLSVIAGVLRGLVGEVMALAGWLVAWLLARAWAVDVGAALHIGEPGGDMARLSGLVVTFVAVLLCWRLLTWLLQQVIQATPLAVVDRFLGAVFGMARGVVVLLVLVSVFGLTPLSRQPSWQVSRGVQWMGTVHAVLSPWLPGDWGPATQAPTSAPVLPKV